MLFLFCCLIAVVQGQSAAPMPPLARVEAVAPAGPAKPGGRLTLLVQVAPREGIHIYAPPQKTFKPISLTIDGTGGLTIAKPQFPPASSRKSEGETIRVYDRVFSIAVPVSLPREAQGTATVTGTLLYQACDDLVCYRPVTVPVRWDIQIH